MSLSLFFLSLFFPAYYYGEAQESYISLSLFLTGWLGILFDGHFSWIANPLYFIALVFRKDYGKSTKFGVMSLVFALSFLLYAKIAISEAPTHVNIVGYGFGYFLWVLSIGVLTVGQWAKWKEKTFSEIAKFEIVWIGICSFLFMYQFCFKDNSHCSLQNERKKIFEQNCKNAKQTIYIKNQKAESVYFNQISEIKFGNYGGIGWHVIWNIGVNNLYIEDAMLRFIEYKNYNKSSTKQFIRYSANRKREEVDKIESEFCCNCGVI